LGPSIYDTAGKAIPVAQKAGMQFTFKTSEKTFKKPICYLRRGIC